ncbi:unnamed protein product [Microthlaspi erraticum]|uniref:Uncharacterized protein n=1 Tax=Microthlaspi erraticum TaxID=1685480 RepID=A0A6D2KKY9_9BRAS|nr:unnamed protein product [Microthlaspi erraticum]
MECWRRQSREQPGCQPGSGNPILALCMQTRSRGSSNLLSPHELQRAEREKRNAEQETELNESRLLR